MTEVPHEEEILHARTTRKNFAFVVLASYGSYIFGYANNVVTGSLAQTSFNEKFLSESNAQSIIGGVIGGFFGGAFFGSLLQAWVSPRYGRRATTGLAAIILIISGAIMAASYRIELFLTFRVVSGIGAGILTSNVPTYISEISPSHSRGILTSLHGISINAAYVSSSLFAFGFNFVHKPYQWRLQFIIFTFASGLLLLSVFYLPESPRWLVEKERYDEAERNLRLLHVSPDGEGERLVQAEMIQIRYQIESEKDVGTSYWHIFTTRSLLERALCSIVIWIMNIGCGILVISNLTPLLFKGLGFDQNIQLGLSVVWVFTSGVGTLTNGLMLDRFGRRPLLLIGGVIVSCILIIEALLQKEYLGTTFKPGLNAATAFFFIYVLFWASFIDNTTYVYIPEIWPTHLRSKGAAIAYCSYYSVAIATASPATLAFNTIGYKYYFVFLALCIVTIIYIYFKFPETNKLTLEEIAEKFGEKVAVHIREDGEIIKEASEHYEVLELTSSKNEVSKEEASSH
ncbi:hypothetical protein B7463_g9057, partial [Scytalidium lignicola]